MIGEIVLLESTAMDMGGKDRNGALGMELLDTIRLADISWLAGWTWD
jgi:hypothetical protein